MKIDSIVRAALLGLSLGVGSAPIAGFAETLKVTDTGPSRALTVPMNRAVVVESETPFAELSIANPGIADISTLSDRTIYVLGKTPGRTTLTLLGPDGSLMSNVDVHVTPDISEFKERLRQILPGEGVEVRTANDGIVLSGVVSSPSKMALAMELAQRYAPERVSNMMSVGGTQQVMLKVRFAEMSRSTRKALSSSVRLGNAPGSSVNVGGTTGTWLRDGNSLPDAKQITVGADKQGVMSIGFGAGSFSVGVLLEALESKGVVRTLAEPNLTALSGQEATFLAGGEIPTPVPQDGGVTTIEFKPFGVELAFVPTVLTDDVINLELVAAVSSIDRAIAVPVGNGFVNGFRRRETKTTVELRDGESFAIAGLIEDDFQDAVGAVPWLGDLPVLGALFRSSEYQRRQSELVIIVSAHLVTPTRGEFLAVPTDRIRPPSEKDLFLNGKTAAASAPKAGIAAEVAKQDFSGSYGYVME
ncbi:pilus assembly protein CpaC [Aliiroseovarius halocynthiae]|uniref:Type II and III secretion system protein family protein n=1 Tax=Aliiroseovarius halocynthiae TaxID=985055 RepID=A0A545SV34_9RHOB|nr:type II and III secretion system protein family protein [Aliiroseovarius halocynthiae]TQV68823.1 type II and III secretion system protein family protein [Aliiroseovarius halocynthiae]SMR71251.1 pilus assembly protein CpaC [Aliiroseovarius halocynthiae]